MELRWKSPWRSQSPAVLWLCCSHPELLRLSPALCCCSCSVVFQLRLPGRHFLGCSQNCIPQGLPNRAGAAGQAFLYPLGSSFWENLSSSCKGNQPCSALQKSGGFMSSWWIFNDFFFLTSCRICSVFHLRHHVLVNRLLFGKAPSVATEFKGTLAHLNKL